MANFTVTNNTDNGQGNVQGSLSWAIARANATAGNDTITLTTDVTLTDEVQQLIDSDITLEGRGASNDGDAEFNISGNDTHRPLFIRSGTVNINNVDIVNGLAKGEDGYSGDAGLGGGVFIYSGNVTLSNVDIRQNQAIGGDGFGRSSIGSSSSIPFFSRGEYGRSGRRGGDGTNGGFGRGGGAGGDSSERYAGGGDAGDGGFGGGGGGAGRGGEIDNGRYEPRYLYYAASGSPGEGGFGGGNGGFADESNSLSDNAMSGYGGGGAGLGGGLFIRTGNLNLDDVDFIDNKAEGGYGDNSGKGFGGGLFALHITENENGNNSTRGSD